MPQRTSIDVAALVVRVGLGAMFLYSAGKKVVAGGPHAFAQDVANYKVLMDPYNLWVACLLITLEIVTGLCLVLGVLNRGAILAGMGMTGMFLFGIGQGWARGLDISCGCFGKSEAAVSYPLHTAGLLALLGAFGFLWWAARHRGAVYVFGGEKMKLPG